MTPKELGELTDKLMNERSQELGYADYTDFYLNADPELVYEIVREVVEETGWDKHVKKI